MKCYYAPGEDAVAVCRVCGRGLSFDYAADSGKGLICKGRCEEEMREWIAIGEHTKSLRAKQAAAQKAPPSRVRAIDVFNMVIGAVFAAFGAYRDFDTFLLAIGGAFFVYGIYGLVSNFKSSGR